MTRTGRSEALFQRAIKVIPGGVNSPVRAFGGWGHAAVLRRRAGAVPGDVDGNRYVTWSAAGGR